MNTSTRIGARLASVIITVCDGTVDYSAEGDVAVVLVDFDRHDCNRSFPDDVDRDIALLRELDHMPWTEDLIKRLTAIRNDIVQQIRSEPPPPEVTPPQ